VLPALAAAGEAQRLAIMDAGLRDGGFSDRELAEPAPDKARDQYSTFVEYRLSWALTNLKRDGLVKPTYADAKLYGVAPSHETTKPGNTGRLRWFRPGATFK
jgi:hypothetical protein